MDKKVVFELEKPVHVVAIAQGYYGNRIINAGQRFQYNGGIKRNRKGDFVLPLWVEFDKTVEGNEIKVKGREAQGSSNKEDKKPSRKASNKDIKDLV